MKRNLVARRFWFFACLVVLLSFGLSAQAQAPNIGANADIVKMIQAGLPEAAIISKIHSGAGSLDTSADALIALKKAGATDAEVTALASAEVRPVVAPASAAAPVTILGGVLMRTRAGDPFVKFSEEIRTIFPNNDPSNSAFLVSYEGKPAIRMPAQHIDSHCTMGSLLITKDSVVFNPYLRDHGFCPASPKKVEFKADDRKYADEVAFSMPRGDVHLVYKAVISGYYPHAVAFEESKHARYYAIGWHLNAYTPCLTLMKCQSLELYSFLESAIQDFDGTVAAFMRASGVTDVNAQLTSDAHFHLITFDEWPKYVAIYQKQIDITPTGGSSGGSGLAGLAQIIGAGANVLQAQASGNMQATIQAQQVYQQTAAQVIENGGATTSAPAPQVAGTPQQAQASINSTSQSAAAGGVMYNGPNAEWVRIVLATAGPYSCSPSGKIKVPSKSSCQRDGEVYKAQALAWGSECSEQTGFHDDAVKIANTLVQTLQSAKRLCGAQAPTGPVHCDTDRILSCSQLPN